MSLRDMWKTVGGDLAQTGKDLGHTGSWGSLGHDIKEAGKAFGKAAVKSTQTVADKAGGWVDRTEGAAAARQSAAEFEFLGSDPRYAEALRLLAKDTDEYTKQALRRMLADIAAHRQQYERETLPAAAGLTAEEARPVIEAFERGVAEVDRQLLAACGKSFREFDAKAKDFFEGKQA